MDQDIIRLDGCWGMGLFDIFDCYLKAMGKTRDEMKNKLLSHSRYCRGCWLSGERGFDLKLMFFYDGGESATFYCRYHVRLSLRPK